MKLTFKFSVEDLIKDGRTTEVHLQQIISWLSTLKDSRVPGELQGELLALFLLSCDNDIELTKKTIISHYHIKNSAPQLFDQRNLDRKDLKQAFQTFKLIYLPERIEGNNAVIYIKLRDTNYRNMEVIPTMKAALMLLDIEREDLPPSGIVYLIDMQGVGIMHILKIRIDSLMTYFKYLADGMPAKFVGIHFLNGGFVTDKLIGMIKRFLLPHIMNRLHCHRPDYPRDELFKIIPKRNLPEELDGDLGPEEELCKETMALLDERKQYFEDEERMRKNVALL
ncbi:unnamed protein product [Phyllotreta striolata]|uniref:CRAL-TRIO domain-containing protein n=1 Tax=Phyllotreta striolata TaxID=444603 RepID=A0A9N9XLX6_PHYSR|nr:unnamed protein product [Phyllotreta striolata]